MCVLVCRSGSKVQGKMDVLKIPKRSPDLSLLDFVVWKEVNRRSRNQEKS